MTVPFLDLSAQYLELKSELDAALRRVVESAAFVGGEEVRSFERELGAYLGARHAVGVANGTDALEIALQALGVGPGDSVLTVPFTFAATIEAIVRVGARPMLVDVDEEDLTLNVEAAANRMERHRAKAVIAVHLYGHPADMQRLRALADAHGAALIEDAAQAHGASCLVDGQQRRVGSFGDAACFSFYPTKNLGAMGDAGAIVTQSEEVAERARLLASHGESEKYRHVLPNGRNSRLDAIQAAVLRVKLRHLDRWNAGRRALARHYGELLSGLPLRLPSERTGRRHVYHQYAIRVASRDRVKEALARAGIGTAVHYPLALHQQEGFRALVGNDERFPVSEASAREILSLPIFPQLDAHSVGRVAGELRRILAADQPQ